MRKTFSTTARGIIASVDAFEAACNEAGGRDERPGGLGDGQDAGPDRRDQGVAADRAAAGEALRGGNDDE